MISTAQNTNAILYWLNEFIRVSRTHKKNFSFPKEVITDFDRALMGAVVKAFTGQDSLVDYLSICFDLLQNKKHKLPRSLIRLDICHFMNVVAKWKFWSNYPARVKEFYMRSIALLRNQKTLKGIESHAKAIFITALNTNIGPDSSSENSRKFLTASIRGTKLDDEYFNSHGKDSDLYLEDGSDDEQLSNSNIFLYVKNIYSSCEEMISVEEETSNVNGYLCTHAAKKFKSLLPYFPLFSEVMPPIFKYGSDRPTSAFVESEFNDLKNRILKDYSMPMRADYFICHHLSSFSGKLKCALANSTNDPTLQVDNIGSDENNFDEPNTSNINNNDEKFKDITNKANNVEDWNAICNRNINKRKNVNDLNEQNENVEIICSDNKMSEVSEQTDESDLNYESNWRNKNAPKRPRRYGEPRPNFDPDLPKTTMIPVIINGNYCQNVHDKEKIFIVKNTCPFDSTCQILATCLLNNKAYKEIIDNDPNPIHLCAQILLQDGQKIKFFKQRAYLLHEVTKSSEAGNIITVKAQSNIANFLIAVFAKTPSCTISHICQICGKHEERTSAVVGVNHNDMKCGGFKDLEKAIRNSIFNRKCCSQTQTMSRKYGPTLLVDTDMGSREQITLNKIPPVLTLEEETYTLAGVVAYVGAFKLGVIGHYVAYIPMFERWLLFDGDSKNPKSSIIYPKKLVHAHMCIYVINKSK